MMRRTMTVERIVDAAEGLVVRGLDGLRMADLAAALRQAAVIISTFQTSLR